MEQVDKHQTEVDMAKYHLRKIAEQAFIENANTSSFVPGVSGGFSSLQTTMTKDVFIALFMKYFSFTPPEMVDKLTFTLKSINAACQFCIDSGGGCGHIDREPEYYMICDALKNFRYELIKGQ